MNSWSAAQGEIWFVRLDPVEGQEQAGERPALVISIDTMNRHGLSMVVPGTTRQKRYPGRVYVPAGVGGLKRDTWFACNQIRAVDRRRLRRRVGTPGTEYLRLAVGAVTALLELPEE